MVQEVIICVGRLKFDDCQIFTPLPLISPAMGNRPAPGSMILKSYTNILLDFFREAGWYRVFLVGHSMGGAIALQFALEHPEHVIGMSLLSTSASFSIKKRNCRIIPFLQNLRTWS